ncbi:class I SAM-dependent methyltransferase [Aliifodinibius sp. S!AR15-10]|uniref:class I SAM-dependent methyltransferase n=1 Tax=Aliifodinibius sp. S!AR15-10 TaxID=2950437 RepID=UPI002859A992|nr:methyltransferase domain-containing protein [Aliifodinibius sp. S!AR15-10]MDR8394306.1 class I SAM-dependent methyltransferase [Aliifodinibius sp. S!AR15-10]
MSDLSIQELQQIAESYQKYLVPAMFKECSEQLVSHAGITPGQRVLDIACGTGILARTAAKQVGENGSVVGLDMNPGMLSVARQLAPDLEWQQGIAEELPFEDNSFDITFCQFSLMFFQDKQTAIREMLRILTSQGRLYIAVFNSLEHIPAYQQLLSIYADFVDEDKVHFLSSPFQLGDIQELNSLLLESGLESPRITSGELNAVWPDVRSLVLADVEGWFPLAGIELGDDQVEEVIKQTKSELGEYINGDGSIAFTMPYHLISHKHY